MNCSGQDSHGQVLSWPFLNHIHYCRAIDFLIARKY